MAKKATRKKAKVKQQPEETAPVEVASLKLKWVDSGVPTQHATNMLVQYEEGEFHLRFFERQMPTVWGPPEMMHEQLAEMGELSVNCVAHIVVSAPRMPGFVEALKSNLERNVSMGDDDARSNGKK